MIELKDIVIREANDTDAFEVTDLLTELGLQMPEKEIIPEYWKRLWAHNPYYKIFPQNISGWLMEYKAETVGFFGLIPRVCYLNNEAVPVAIASQWGVKKEFRQFTYLLCEKFFHENPISLKVVTTAIKPTGKIFEKYGGKRVPSPRLTDVYMVPFNLHKLVSYKLKTSATKKKFAVAAKFLKVVPWKLQYLLYQKDVQLLKVDIKNVPEGYVSFWEKYKKNNNDRLLSSRDPDHIQWFYSGKTRNWHKHVFVYRCKQTNDIIGYAAVMEEPTVKGSFTRYKIIDLLAENTEVKRKIIKALIHFAFKQKADVLEVHLPGMMSKSDIPAFSLTRVVEHWPVYYHCSDERLMERLKNAENWHISAFDGDTALG
jgi:hypothetical protein